MRIKSNRFRSFLFILLNKFQQFLVVYAKKSKNGKRFHVLELWAVQTYLNIKIMMRLPGDNERTQRLSFSLSNSLTPIIAERKQV